MTPENFCYWLRGHIDMNDESVTITRRQYVAIREHLDLVFTEVKKSDAPESEWASGHTFGPVLTC